MAIIKSCSTINAALLVFKINLFSIFAQIILYSESKYADGSSIKYTSQGLPNAKIIATLYNSPPKEYKCFFLKKWFINIKFFIILIDLLKNKNIIY